MAEEEFKLGQLAVTPGEGRALFTLAHQDSPELRVRLAGPIFEVDSQERDGFGFTGRASEIELPRGGREIILGYVCAGQPDLRLEVRLRGFPGSPVMRFQYRLTASTGVSLTKTGGRDRLRYFCLEGEALCGAGLWEAQLSHFDPVAHAYMPNWMDRRPEEWMGGMALAGPALFFHSNGHTLLAAYEHGADHPDGFLEFRIEPGEEPPGVALWARKGNYYAGQALGPGRPWESAWFELGLAPIPRLGFLPLYRRFILEELCEDTASRQPLIFYNTWNYQERQRYFRGRPYLESMHAGRMLAEIEVAHRLGVNVFVIDTGWYGKTGDWQVDRKRFPDGLREVKQALDKNEMRLGLWFNPTVAALTSRIFREHPEYRMTWNGQPSWQGRVWETEESTGMCLASGYAGEYIDAMQRLYHELGVTYFKWDGIGQYGCDSPLHEHGTQANPAQERADCYAYEMGRRMISIAQEAARRCPGIIVDFDITEGGRFVGLGFLSAGKYFLVNNGPYFNDFDIPPTVKMDPNTINVFFYPGAARPRICRQGVRYDPLIPSILFLTHYLPDGPALAQRNSMASLVLGGNGLWGDLLGLSEEEIALVAEHLADYKEVAGAVTRASPRVSGFAGSSPEIHEKIDPAAASGLISFFTVTPGRMVHLTQPLDLARLKMVKGADGWERTADGRLKIEVELERNAARVVYVFGNV